MAPEGFDVEHGVTAAMERQRELLRSLESVSPGHRPEHEQTVSARRLLPLRMLRTSPDPSQISSLPKAAAPQASHPAPQQALGGPGHA